MLTIESSNDQAATISTEHSLATPATAGTRVFAVDVNAMAAGDVTVLRIKTAVRSGGTARLVYQATFVGPPSTPVVFSPPVPMATGGEVTLQQTAGTGRTYPWAVYLLG